MTTINSSIGPVIPSPKPLPQHGDCYLDSDGKLFRLFNIDGQFGYALFSMTKEPEIRQFVDPKTTLADYRLIDIINLHIIPKGQYHE